MAPRLQPEALDKSQPHRPAGRMPVDYGHLQNVPGRISHSLTVFDARLKYALFRQQLILQRTDDAHKRAGRRDTQIEGIPRYVDRR